MNHDRIDQSNNFLHAPTPMAGRILQRKCVCGQHTSGGGQCPACAEKDKLKHPLQPKLEIGEANDSYEQEADRVAQQVMRMPTTKTSEANGFLLAKPIIQRRPSSTQTGSADVPPSIHGVLRSSGQPLDPSTRESMEQRFGHDFSQVRVHTGAKAAKSARAINARAYTVGPQLVFDGGQYVPQSTKGRLLLAHELTHVIQQSVSSPRPVLQRWAYGAGSHNTGGGNTFRELTNDEQSGANGMDAAMAIVDRLVAGSNSRATTCQRWYVDNCTTPRTLAQLNNRAQLWIWRQADGSAGNGLTDGSNRIHHAVTEQLFNGQSKWALAATVMHEYWHDCEAGQPDIGDDAKAACGLPNI